MHSLLKQRELLALKKIELPYYTYAACSSRGAVKFVLFIGVSFIVENRVFPPPNYSNE